MKGKTVLVTGAGGSIGSALCKRIAQMDARMLVLFDHSEFALYTIDEALSCPRVAMLGDVKDWRRLIEAPYPDIVFHCAAYKHVPMLESGINQAEGERNNVEGTKMVMHTFRGADHITLLSTDKAVNPACVMGRSKREAERIALRYKRHVARLGNVWESSGSVLPKFRAQIAAGGPVTVTHPEATRYFIGMDRVVDFLLSMLTREPGIHTADMGPPQNIFELARDMIGSRNIQIEITGLRPGEKLHEELEA